VNDPAPETVSGIRENLGAIAHVTGEDVIPREVQHRRDLDTLADMLNRLGPFPALRIYFSRAGGRGRSPAPLARVPQTARSSMPVSGRTACQLRHSVLTYVSMAKMSFFQAGSAHGQDQHCTGFGLWLF
jgi:hypothetical protein